MIFMNVTTEPAIDTRHKFTYAITETKQMHTGTADTSGVIYEKGREASTRTGIYTLKTLQENARKRVANQKVQSGLSALGLYIGPIDGNLNSARSIRAIREYQRIYCDTGSGGVMTEKTKTIVSDLLHFKGALSDDHSLAKITDQLQIPGTQKQHFASVWTYLRDTAGLNAAESAVICNTLADASFFSDKDGISA